MVIAIETGFSAYANRPIPLRLWEVYFPSACSVPTASRGVPTHFQTETSDSDPGEIVVTGSDPLLDRLQVPTP